MGLCQWHWRWFYMFILAVPWKTKLFEFVEFYLEDGLEKAVDRWHWQRCWNRCFFQWHWRILCMFTVQVSNWYDSFSQKMVLKWTSVSDTGGDSACLFFRSQDDLRVRSQKMVLKWAFFSDIREDAACSFLMPPGRQIILDGTVLYRMWSWKGCSLVTMAKMLLKWVLSVALGKTTCS